MADYVSAHGWVSGNVQGVGFRYFARDIAARYDLRGWVRNLPDGRVEFIAEGTKGLLTEFLKDMKRGPKSGHVADLQIDWGNYTAEFKDFKIAF
jgi:acylphosphatase